MNFLAHLYLAGDDEGLSIGNFIADGVRGKEIDKYPENIQRGIVLHRKIDHFTDTHPIVKQTVIKLRETAGKYAPVVSDIVYDHFLAHFWLDYSPVILSNYAKEKYRFLKKNIRYVPSRMQELLHYMIEQNWLVNYAYLEGIATTLRDLSKRVSFTNNMADSIIDLKKDYRAFESDFRAFFPELQAFVAFEISQLQLVTK